MTPGLELPTRALSIRQPWAWLIANGHKWIENRSWRTSFRGPFWIHASQTYDRPGELWVRRRFPELKLPKKEELERGGIVGRAVFRAVVRVSPSPWFEGPWGFLIEDAEPVPFFPARGMLGFFSLELEALERLARRGAA